MNGLVYHIVSGQSFFSGTALLVFAVVCATRPNALLKRMTIACCVMGTVLIGLSSTPIPYWYYGVMIAAMTAWGLTWFKPGWQVRGARVFVAVLVVGVGLEIPYHILPTVPNVAGRSLTIVGDSVTAGVGGNESSTTWPRLLSDQYQVTVQDISHMGETAASALKRAESESIRSSLVIVEIGGNDVLGSTSSSKFAVDLDALLNFLSTPNCQIVMFELPLPPLCHELGRIQRSLAAKYDVVLIPKRIFLSVIAGNDSTLDSIHLSQAGHQYMADRVWSIVGSAFVQAASSPQDEKD